MPKQTTSNKKQLAVLVILLLVFAVMSFSSFKDRLNIPTEKRLQALRAQIADKRVALRMAEEEAKKYNDSLRAIRDQLALLKYNANLERDAQSKIDRILDNANVTKTKATVNIIQNRTKSNLQQVNVTLSFEDITMRKLCDLFETFGIQSLKGTAPLYWTRIDINLRNIGRRGPAPSPRRPGPPGTPQQPAPASEGPRQQIDVNATVSSYSLYSPASDLVFSDTYKAPAANGKNTTKPAAPATKGGKK